MKYAIKNFNRKSLYILLLSILLLFIFMILNPQPQKPLVQLSEGSVNKLMTASISNLVLFDKEAHPVQIIDLFRDKYPQVRSVEDLIKYMAMERKQDLKLTKQKVNFIKGQPVGEKSKFVSIANEKNNKVPVREEPPVLASMLKNEILELRANGVFYVEYRNGKDQHLQVIELKEKGFCQACIKAALSASPIENTYTQLENSNTFLNFVIPVAQACDYKHDCGCRSGRCKKVSTGNGCCNC